MARAALVLLLLKASSTVVAAMPRTLAFAIRHHHAWRCRTLPSQGGLQVLSSRAFPPPSSGPPPTSSIRGRKRPLSSTSAVARVTDDVAGAARELREHGRLVAFPTETVYGLGANAYNETAIHHVFQVKGRPLTDPLIVHIPASDGAWPVYRCSEGSTERSLLSHLAKRFWPGPLTLVAPAAETIPPAVTAGTGWVGVRCPQLTLARRFLKEAGVPVVAPSANRFGHVSPTTSDHVVADLGGHDIIILAVGGGGDGKEEEGECEVGIESTVAKVDVESRQITILRSGAVTPSALRHCLEGTEFRDFTVHGGGGTITNNKGPSTPLVVGVGPQVSPGTSLRHYAPDAPTYLIRPTSGPEPWLAEVASDAVVLDVGGRLAWLRPHCYAYRDLCPSGGGIREAARGLFEALRWAEREANRRRSEGVVPVVGKVLLCDLRGGSSDDGGDGRQPSTIGGGRSKVGGQEEEEFVAAVADRMMRAASGKVLEKEKESRDA